MVFDDGSQREDSATFMYLHPKVSAEDALATSSYFQAGRRDSQFWSLFNAIWTRRRGERTAIRSLGVGRRHFLPIPPLRVLPV